VLVQEFDDLRGRIFMDIDALINNILEMNIFSETEVRTKIAVPIFQLLGYPEDCRAEEFPVYGREGRMKLHAKSADIIYFSSGEFNQNRNDIKEERDWVEDHSLMVIELKRPGESIDEPGQARFYSMWARVPYYVLTNGKEIVAYRLENYYSDTLLFHYSLGELPLHWVEINEFLHRDVIAGYKIKDNTNKSKRTGYEDYNKAILAGLENQFKLSLSRTVSNYQNSSTLPFPIKISSKDNNASFISESYTKLIECPESFVILAEPGGGKTFLIQILAREVLRLHLKDTSSVIPIILNAKYWCRSFESIVEGLFNELEPFFKFLTHEVVENDLKKGRYLILIDGLDEVTESIDKLHYELLNLSKFKDLKIIVTCRLMNYHQELNSRFNICQLDPLTNQQIEDYAKEVLGQHVNNFLREIGIVLANLVQNPLFLFMTTEVIKSTQNHRLPQNKAELYLTYTKFLLNDWYKAKGIQNLVVSQSVKEQIFAEYAKKSFRQSGNELIFDEIISTHLEKAQLEIAREELYDSGLIRTQTYGPEFYHPSFQEFYFAFYNANTKEENLKDFISKYYMDESYSEVFIFLSGLLRDGNRQSILFDFLEENNLYLFRRCLEARFDRQEQIHLNWSNDFVVQYFEQVRCSYLRIIKSHFSSLLKLFHPWFGSELENKSSYDLTIEGSMDQSIPSVRYQFNLMESNSDTICVTVQPYQGSPLISIPGMEGAASFVPISLSFSNGYTFYDLRQAALGIDSAREIAFEAIKKRLKEIFEHRLMFSAEDHALGCEYVENQFKELTFSRQLLPIPAELIGLSLYTQSIDEIIPILQRFSNIRGFRYPSGRIKSINFPLILFYILRMKENNVNPKDYLLPLQDKSWEEIPVDERVVWSPWSDEQLCFRIEKFYDFFQLAYRHIVKTCFPTLKRHLYFYRIGPVRFHIAVYKAKKEEKYLHGGYISLTWEPVASDADKKTIVKLIDEKQEIGHKEQLKEFERIREQLRGLGRSFEQVITGGGHSIGHYTSQNDILHQEVYKQLVNDFKGLFGKH
jgi:hypothetical protein